MKINISEEKAIEISEMNLADKLDSESIFLFQISQEGLCFDFREFHKATEEVLDRSVFNHEFVDLDSLFEEYLEKKELRKIMKCPKCEYKGEPTHNEVVVETYMFSQKIEMSVGEISVCPECGWKDW